MDFKMNLKSKYLFEQSFAAFSFQLLSIISVECASVFVQMYKTLTKKFIRNFA